MDYISSALVRAGYNVNIVSPSWTENMSGFYDGKTIDLNSHVTVTLGPTFGGRNKIVRGLRILYSWLWLLFWMLFHIKYNEKVIVYHSLWIAVPLFIGVRIKRFKMILEAEEIYCKIYQHSSYVAKLEHSIIRYADSYIFPNDIMPDTVNIWSKPYVVVYGTYEKHIKTNRQTGDGKVHLVYAGIIDRLKAGAFNAVESACYLSNDYVMHILGSGDRESLQQTITSNEDSNCCRVILHGFKSQNDYIEFMQTCHIGLSTQTTTGIYQDYQFPSKILSYLSLGLRVVSARIDCVTKSRIGDVITYYAEDTPAAIAAAIKSIDVNTDNKAVERIEELDTCFVNDIKNLLEHEG